MCQTNIYVDRYPDGREVTFTQTQYCRYSTPHRPCHRHSTITHQARNIQYSDPTAEYMMTHPQPPYYPQQPRTQYEYPDTPPRSRGRDDTPPRPLRRHSKRDSVTILPRSEMPVPHREHRKERIMIVDSPPTPRTPPMRYSRPQVFTAPSSPVNPSYSFDTPRHDRGRPIIVDERASGPRRPSREREFYGQERSDSRTANVGERLPIPTSSPRTRHNTSLERGLFAWDSPSSSHTSFDSRARREAEEAAARARKLERDEQRRAQAEQEKRNSGKTEAQRVMEARIEEQNARIRARPAVPLPKSALKRRESMREYDVRPVTPPVPRVTVNGLTAEEVRAAEEKEVMRRLEQREWESKRERGNRERSAEAKGRGRVVSRERESEEEVLKRLRERQLPRRRASVGLGGRRHRVLYDDGVYRWE